VRRYDSPAALLDETPGAELGVGRSVEVTQAMIDCFAELSGDDQWIHVDVERASSGPYGRTIAHGLLTLSLLTVMMDDVLQVDNVSYGVLHGFNRVRFPAALPSGARIHASVRFLNAKRRGEFVEAAFEITCLQESEERPVCVAELVGLFQ
jgi:acyl dehydratase